MTAVTKQNLNACRAITTTSFLGRFNGNSQSSLNTLYKTRATVGSEMITLTILITLIMCESIPAASIPRPLGMHGESRGPGIWQLIVSRPPGHLEATKKNCFVTSCPHFRRRSESRVSRINHCHFGVGEEHLSTIKYL